MIAPVRHVGDDHCSFRAAFYGDTGGGDLIERNRDRIAVAVNYIPDAVTDQNDIDTGLVHDTCGRIIIGGEANKLLTVLFCGLNERKINFLGLVGLKVGHRRLKSSLSAGLSLAIRKCRFPMGIVGIPSVDKAHIVRGMQQFPDFFMQSGMHELRRDFG